MTTGAPYGSRHSQGVKRLACNAVDREGSETVSVPVSARLIGAEPSDCAQC